MKKPEPELCWKCGKPKPIHLVLKNKETGETRLLCQEHAESWILYGGDWPETTEKKSKI